MIKIKKNILNKINLIKKRTDLIKTRIDNIFLFFLVLVSPVAILFIFFIYYYPVVAIVDKFNSYYFSSSIKEANFLFNIVEDNLSGKFNFIGIFFIFLIIFSLAYQSYYYYKSFVYSKIPWWSPEKWSFYITVIIFVFIHLQTFDGFQKFTIEEKEYPKISMDSINFIKIFPTIVMSYLLIHIIDNLYVKFADPYKEIFYLCVVVVFTTYFFNDFYSSVDFKYDANDNYIFYIILYSLYVIVANMINLVLVVISYYYIPVFLVSILNLSYITFTFNIIFSIIFYIQEGEISLYILFMRFVDILNTFDSLNLPPIVAIMAFVANLISVFFVFKE